MAAIPGRLDWNTKRHFEQELLSFMVQEDGKYLITKDETRDVIKTFLKQESAELFTDLDKRLEMDVESIHADMITDINKQFAHVEVQIKAYIEHKIDRVAELIAERLSNKYFEQEVAKAVQKKLNNRGKF
jgi:hypothetical protein